ncbi:MULTISPECIES: hypothetical protein [Hallerella]|uniref:hypothetical protein n=1 Tax=Hallerella TaxID=2815788 RepID=UPI0025910B6F|nr:MULTISPECIES: hypothetical protein [Hallerella]
MTGKSLGRKASAVLGETLSFLTSLDFFYFVPAFLWAGKPFFCILWKRFFAVKMLLNLA